MVIFTSPLFFAVWVLLSLLIGQLGTRRKFGFYGHFLISIFLSPLCGMFVLLATSPRPRRIEKK